MKKKAKKQERKRRASIPDGIIVRKYKGVDCSVEVKDGKCYYAEQVFNSLTAVARFITGYPAISGPAFFKTKSIALDGSI